MGKFAFKPGNMLYPLPAVLVSVRGKDGKDNIMTVAWAGTVCTNPPMVSVSVRPERYSYHMLEESGEFVINLTTEKLCYATDYCGVKSGRDEDKFERLGLHKLPSREVQAPGVAESPVNIECRVKSIQRLGSHHMFIAEVLAVTVDDSYMDPANRFRLAAAEPLVYCHGGYYGLGKRLGSFGYSVSKRKKAEKSKKKNR